MTKQKQSKLDGYAERLDEWFGVEKKTLAEVRDALRLDGCSVSLSRLSDWWADRQRARMETGLLEQIASGARHCKQVEAEFAKAPAPELDTLVRLHRVLILKLSTEGSADPDKLELVNRMMREVQKFARLEQLAQQNKIEERKLALLEEKARQADQAEGVARSALSAEEKQAKMREIFGLA